MQNTRFSPSLLNVSTSWFKHSYNHLEEQNNEWFIIADESSNVTNYNPYGFFPVILDDFLKIEDLIPIEQRGKLFSIDYELPADIIQDILEKIIGFVNQYGLLGLNNYKPSNPIRVAYLNEELKDIDYFNLNDTDKNKPIFKNSILESTKPLLLKPVENPIFESTAMFLDALEMIYRFIKYWYYFKEKRYKPDDTWTSIFGEPVNSKITWFEFFQQFGYSQFNLATYNLEYKVSLTYESSWRLSYDCNTLFSALCLMAIHDLTSKYQSIKLCVNCGQPFARISKKAIYCSDACGNLVRVHNFRNKHKNDTI